MKKSLPQAITPEIPDSLLSIIFAYSASQQYSMAAFLAKQATFYRRLDEDKSDRKAIHLCVFTKTKQQAAHAAALIKIVGKWRTTQIHTSAKIQSDPKRVSKVLECYFQSLTLSDHRAHCYWSGDGRYGIAGEPYPCRQLKVWTEFETEKFDLGKKLNIAEDQRIHALAIQQNCEWCPHFSSKIRA